MIVCLPDLLRGTTAFPHGFFDLVREPILQGCGLDIAYPPDSRQPSNLIPGFELETFYRLINNSNERPAWEPYFHAIPEAAAAYLQQHIPPGSLVLSFEMPPWLAQLCNSAGIDFIDIRPSPLRFGRDLYIALKTNNLSLYQHISSHHVLPEELRLEAAELAASVRMHQQRLEESNRYPFNLDGSLIFIGQAPYDASLLSPGKASPLNCSDFANQLRQLAHGRRVLHKPHPFAVDHAQLEQDMLQHILQTEVRPCWQNAYQILSCHHDVVLAGISSGMLQEAAWFGKTAHTLFQPFTPLADSIKPVINAYQQVHFDTWLSPGFWHAILTPERPAPRVAKLPPRQHHHARHLLDQWWDYAKVMTWEKSLAIESFERSGGIVLRQRIEALEQNQQINRNLVQKHAPCHPPAWQNTMQAAQTLFSRQPQAFGRGEFYQGHEDWNLPGQRPTLARLQAYGLEDMLPPRANVLDIGCNIGLMGLALSPAIHQYQGIDINPALIKIARLLAQGRGVNNCNYDTLSFHDFIADQPAAQYDVVLSFAVHVWIGLPMPEYARLVAGLLRPQGLLVVESNNLATNDTQFFASLQAFLDTGLSLRKQGMLKDDGVIERGFFILSKPAAA